MRRYAALLVAAGRGRARIPTCEHTLRHACTIARRTLADAANCRYRNLDVVVLRALSFFGPGEVRTLRVEDADVFRVVLSMMQSRSHQSQMSQALESLCAIEVGTLNNNGKHAVAVIERYAATMTELTGALPGDLLCASDRSGHPPVLAHCTRLECLTEVSRYTPAVWLGLSQLHTLRDVDLGEVSIPAIAAALPRLHTLKAFYSGSRPTSVAGFFTDLLPRLRVFQFNGWWPRPPAEPDVAPSAQPPALPLLEELTWWDGTGQQAPLRWFAGAAPVLLHAPFELIAQVREGRDGAPTEPPSNILSRVSDVRVFYADALPNVCDVARVLRAAPRLRAFRVLPDLVGDASWLTQSTVPLHPSFMSLVHPRLRCIAIKTRPVESPPGPRARDRKSFSTDDDEDDRESSSSDDACGATAIYDDGCASRLRRTCFPRLRKLQVNIKTFYADT
jgi:hypothetical protein